MCVCGGMKFPVGVTPRGVMLVSVAPLVYGCYASECYSLWRMAPQFAQ